MSTAISRNRLAIAALLGAVALTAAGSAAVATELVLIKDGEARAVVVTADEPSPVAAYSAQELVSHVEKATGARLEIAREADLQADDSRERVYVGATRAARQVRLYPTALRGETYRIKATGGDLYIFGREDGHGLFTEGDRFDVIAISRSSQRECSSCRPTWSTRSVRRTSPLSTRRKSLRTPGRRCSS